MSENYAHVCCYHKKHLKTDKLQHSLIFVVLFCDIYSPVFSSSPSQSNVYFSGPPEDPKAAADFIEKKFKSVADNKEKNIYPHRTCATDTEQVQYVLDAVLDTILSSKLKGCGLYWVRHENLQFMIPSSQVRVDSVWQSIFGGLPHGSIQINVSTMYTWYESD